MKKMIQITTAMLICAISTSAFANCYQSEEDSALQVCIDDLAKNEGEGYSNIEGRGVATLFRWVRTTENILITEIDRNTGEPSGCDSGVTIVGTTLTIENLDSYCGILSGDYQEK